MSKNVQFPHKDPSYSSSSSLADLDAFFDCSVPELNIEELSAGPKESTWVSTFAKVAVGLIITGGAATGGYFMAGPWGALAGGGSVGALVAGVGYWTAPKKPEEPQGPAPIHPLGSF